MNKKITFHHNWFKKNIWNCIKEKWDLLNMQRGYQIELHKEIDELQQIEYR
jgi:hypothetical protein